MDSLHVLGELEALDEHMGGLVAPGDMPIEEESTASAVVSVEIEVDEIAPLSRDPETVSVASMEPFDDWSEEAAVDASSGDLVGLTARAVLRDRTAEMEGPTPDPERTVGESTEDSWSVPRLRSWSRDLAGERQTTALSLKLLPLTEEAMADLASGRTINGVELRYLRKMRGVELHTISERTKISVMTLRFIEQDRFDNLPAPIYLRGFVDQYVKLLDLPIQTVDQYMSGLSVHRH
jgi:hypothetical protein